MRRWNEGEVECLETSTGAVLRSYPPHPVGQPQEARRPWEVVNEWRKARKQAEQENQRWKGDPRD